MQHMMTTGSVPEILLTSDVARRLGVSVSMVSLWERTGRLRALRTVGGTRLYLADDVARFAESWQPRVRPTREDDV